MRFSNITELQTSIACVYVVHNNIVIFFLSRLVSTLPARFLGILGIGRNLDAAIFPELLSSPT